MRLLNSATETAWFEKLMIFTNIEMLLTSPLNDIELVYASDLSSKILWCYNTDVIFSIDLNNLNLLHNGSITFSFLLCPSRPLLYMVPGSLTSFLFSLSLSSLHPRILVFFPGPMVSVHILEPLYLSL